MPKNIKGTLCEVCNNKVMFKGRYYCTVSVCNFATSKLDCDTYYYNQDCSECKVAHACPYISDKNPLAENSLVY